MAFGYKNEWRQPGITLEVIRVERIYIRYKQSGARVQETASIAERAIANGQAEKIVVKPKKKKRAPKMTAKKK